MTNAKFVDVTQHTSFMTFEQDQEKSKIRTPQTAKIFGRCWAVFPPDGGKLDFGRRVTINGKVARLGERVSPIDDVVKVNGKVVRAQLPKVDDHCH